MKKNGMLHTGSGKQEESQRSKPNRSHSLISHICYYEFSFIVSHTFFLHVTIYKNKFLQPSPF